MNLLLARKFNSVQRAGPLTRFDFLLSALMPESTSEATSKGKRAKRRRVQPPPKRLADWTGMMETELFALTCKNYGLATVRYPVLEVTATVEPFENGRGFTLRVLRAGKPRPT